MASRMRGRFQAPWENHPGEDDRTAVLGHLRYEIERMAGEASSAPSDAQRQPLLLHVKRLGERLARLEQEEHRSWWFKERRTWTGRKLVEELLRMEMPEPRNIPRGNETGKGAR